MKTNWVVYLLKCKDGTLYCGITNDLPKRITKHNDGKGAKYTKGRGPVTLVAFCGGFKKGDALKMERKIKRMPKNKKVDFLKKLRVSGYLTLGDFL